jgi:ribosome-binding factor A
MKIKTERLANVLLKEIYDILYNKLRDQDIKNTTATFIKLTDDLSYAKVYCTNFDETKINKALKDLNNAEGFVRSELIKRKLPIRNIPKLEFVHDEAISYGMKIEQIIKEKINKD